LTRFVPELTWAPRSNRLSAVTVAGSPWIVTVVAEAVNLVELRAQRRRTAGGQTIPCSPSRPEREHAPFLERPRSEPEGGVLAYPESISTKTVTSSFSKKIGSTRGIAARREPSTPRFGLALSAVQRFGNGPNADLTGEYANPRH
jgi:hypothetical protein